MFKVGDLVMITFPRLGLNGELGVVIKSENFGMGVRCLVHSTIGRSLWFREEEMVKVA